MLKIFGHKRFSHVIVLGSLMIYGLSHRTLWSDSTNTASPSKPALQLDTLIFKNETHWTFWLNGIRMDPHFDVQEWLGQRGFCLIQVKETGILLGSLQDPSLILFLEPRRSLERPTQTKKIKPHKTAGDNEEGLGF